MKCRNFAALSGIVAALLAGCGTSHPGDSPAHEAAAPSVSEPIASEPSAGGPLPAPYAPAETPPANAFDLAKQGGCLDHTLDTCLTNLQAGFHFASSDDVAKRVSRNETIDAQGKHVAKKDKNLLWISGNLEGWNRPSEQRLVSLEYTRSKIVRSVEMSLPGDPARAKSEEDYRKSGLYEAMVLLLGTACPTIERMAVYKFFEKTVKPKIVSEGEKTESRKNGTDTSTFKKALNISYCGKKFSYTSLSGHRKKDITRENPSGSFRHITISLM